MSSERPVRKRCANRRYLETENPSDNNNIQTEKEDLETPAAKVKRRKTIKPKVSTQKEITETNDGSDSENKQVVVSRKSQPKRKPRYSVDYINDLEGQDMRCSMCENFVTKNAQEAKEHLRASHYYIARINDGTPLTMKEVRSALLLASKDVNCDLFSCRCGKVTKWPQTFGDHLAKCQHHGFRLEYEVIETPTVSERAEETTEANGKRRRKSAMAAAKTFSQLARDEFRDQTEANEEVQDRDDSHDEDFQVNEEHASEPEEEFEVDDDISDAVSTAGAEKSTKSIDMLLMDFHGKYRDPIPVPVPEEERARWRSDLQKYGRIKCLECSVVYTTSPGIEYHYQRCNKVEYGYKCQKCGLCFGRNGNRQLLSHLAFCYNMITPMLSSLGRTRLKIAKNHSLSPKDFTDFSLKHYGEPDKPYTPVHGQWKFKKLMWPEISKEEAEPYLTPSKTSPNLRIGKKSAPQSLDLGEVLGEPKDDHKTLYAGGAVWCIRWVPLPLDHETQYFLTVSHSRADKAEFMQMSPELSKGYMNLWSCDSKGEAIECRYTICHDWGFVARVEFCPSRTYTENRLGLLAVTSQDGFVRILALPQCTEENRKTFYLDPVPVAVLEPSDVTVGSTCLAWDPLRGHSSMLVGYANGSIDLFTLKQRTLLLSEDDAFEVSKHVGSHGMSITAVQWHLIEDRRLAVSAAMDIHIIIWDIDQGIVIGKFARSIARDMKLLQFVPSIAVSHEESIASHPCVVVYESGAYKRGDATIMLHTTATTFSIDVNHWRHMLATTDSAGTATISWLTNSTKLHNFKGRNAHVILYEVEQRFADEVDARSAEVAHNEVTLEFKDHKPSWDTPSQTRPKVKPQSRLEYQFNAVLSIAFNPNQSTDHLVASGLRCGIVRLSRVQYRKGK